MKIYWILLGIVGFCTSCTQVVFQDSILIDAPPAVVFEVITNYEAYTDFSPILYDKVEIVSKKKKV